jgi:hypothetical protein
MATQTSSLKPGASDGLKTWTTWIVTILACAYLGWTGFSLYRATAAFSDLYDSMNTEMRGLTLFVFHAYRWLYPSLFGGASAFLITKQFFVRKMWISLTITFVAAVVLGIVGDGIARSLYGPIWDFPQKLK